MTTIENYAILGVSLLALAISIITGIQAKKKHKQIGEALQYIDAKQQITKAVPSLAVPESPKPEIHEDLNVQVNKELIDNLKNMASQLASELSRL